MTDGTTIVRDTPLAIGGWIAAPCWEEPRERQQPGLSAALGAPIPAAAQDATPALPRAGRRRLSWFPVPLPAAGSGTRSSRSYVRQVTTSTPPP